MRTTSVDWPSMIKRQEESGLSQRTFCDQQGLALSTFTYWKRKLHEGTSIELRRPQFIELDVRPSARPLLPEEELVVEMPFGVVMRFRGIAR